MIRASHIRWFHSEGGRITLFAPSRNLWNRFDPRTGVARFRMIPALPTTNRSGSELGTSPAAPSGWSATRNDPQPCARNETARLCQDVVISTRFRKHEKIERQQRLAR